MQELTAAVARIADSALQANQLARAALGLGVAVVNTGGSSDGGVLFAQACGVGLARAALLWIRRSTWMSMLARLTGR